MMYFPSLVAERIHQPTSRNLATMLDTCINTLKITECHVTDRFRWGMVSCWEISTLNWPAG